MFLEKVYENALVIELESAGFAVLQQQNIKVYYENQAQLINYLKATNKQMKEGKYQK